MERFVLNEPSDGRIAFRESCMTYLSHDTITKRNTYTDTVRSMQAWVIYVRFIGSYTPTSGIITTNKPSLRVLDEYL